MSHTETHIGKLKKAVLDCSLEDWCKNKCIELGITELASYNKTWQDQLIDAGGHKKYFIYNDEVWEAIDHIKCDEGDDIDIMIPNEDGTISFIYQFYNGGTCLSECIEAGLSKLSK